MDREAVALSTMMATPPWADTPLGERSAWPRSLAIVVDLVEALSAKVADMMTR